MHSCSILSCTIQKGDRLAAPLGVWSGCRSLPRIDRELAPLGIGRKARIAVVVGIPHRDGRPLGRAAVGGGCKGGEVAVPLGLLAAYTALGTILSASPKQNALTDGLVATDLAVDADLEGAVGAGSSGSGDKTAGVGLLPRCVPCVLARQGSRVFCARWVPPIGGKRLVHEGDGPRTLGRDPAVGAGLDG